ncbi:actin-related protein 2/3 complex subunit 2-A-like [Zophobas morio]|uniref:actin-related protein 2/3 complex subunit 2-A-like n=1 Tax=Zophobas morio TaxID=2755281 RepID=UPI0030828BD3
MIFLEFHSRIIVETLTRAFQSEKPEAISSTVADFDGVLINIETLKVKTNIAISLNWTCYSELEKCGTQEILKREYDDMLTSPRQGYDVTILVDLEKHAPNKDEIIKKASLLKRWVFSAPFEKFFNHQIAETTCSPILINYRSDSSLYLSVEKDRVTCVFTTTFKDEDDVVLGKLALQQFVDIRKERHLQQSPQVLYSHREPPRELQSFNVLRGDNVSYITFVLFPRHFSDKNRYETINLLQSFRNYLHYHIKCSKAHLHSRMRARAIDSIKILNRARPDTEKEKKTASGKTFVRVA